MAGLLFQGNLYLDFLTDAGASNGFIGPINCTSLAIQVQDADEKVRTSMMEDSYGQALDSVLIPKPQKLTIKIDEQGASLLSRNVGGTVASYSQAAQTATVVSVVVKLDKWVVLPYRNTSIVIDSAATPVLTPGDDFIVDHVRGLVKFLSTGSAVEGATQGLKITAAAVTGQRISGGTKPTFYASLMLDGINKADGLRGRLLIDKVNMAPSGDVDPLSGEFLVTTLKGTMIILDDKTAPYVWDTETVFA